MGIAMGWIAGDVEVVGLALVTDFGTSSRPVQPVTYVPERLLPLSPA